MGFSRVRGDNSIPLRGVVHPNSKQALNLPWAVAAAAGANVPPLGSDNTWLNYYWSRQAHFSRSKDRDVTNQIPGFFRYKVVFIGGRARSDPHRTPYSRLDGRDFPGVEIMATGYLNSWSARIVLRECRRWRRCSFWSWYGALLGLGAVRLRIGAAIALTAGDIALVAFGAALALVLGCSCGSHGWLSPEFRRQWLSPGVGVWLRKGQSKPEFTPFPRQHGKGLIPIIPDHLLQRIGSGAYGEVWLARNTIGMFRAVKFVFRDRYSSPEPYLREFRGIEKYMPLSLNHPGFGTPVARQQECMAEVISLTSWRPRTM